MITLITTTANRPIALDLCYKQMKKQTFKGDINWIISDGSKKVAKVKKSYKHIRVKHLNNRNTEVGVRNFIKNLICALPHIQDDLVLFIEDDEFYAPWYLERTVDTLKNFDAVGNIWQPYYNIKKRCYKLFRNENSALCMTGISFKLLPLFEEICNQSLKDNYMNVDGEFWRQLIIQEYSYFLSEEEFPSIGIKGLPGSTGLGIGHENTCGFTSDPDLIQFKKWLGPYWKLYKGFLNA